MRWFDSERTVLEGTGGFHDETKEVRSDGKPADGRVSCCRLMVPWVVVAATTRTFGGCCPTTRGYFYCNPRTAMARTSTCWAKVASKSCSDVGGKGGAIGSGAWPECSLPHKDCLIWLMVNSCAWISTLTSSFED